MKWLLSKGCPLNDWQIFSAAAKNNNLDIMKWLKINECPWNSHIFYYAIKNENIEAMNWLKEMGCPYDNRYIYGSVISKDNKVIIDWVIDNLINN